MRRAPWLSYLLSVGLVLGLLIVPSTTASAQETEATVSDVAELRDALAAGVPVIKLVQGTTYVLDGKPLVVSTPVRISGAFAPPGPESTTIDANGLSRVVDVTSSATNVTIEGVVITGGQAPVKPPKNANGGGIRIASGAVVELVDSTVTGNAALDGGGIVNNGTLTVTASTIDNNTATGKGGGIRDNGSATIENSTIVGNAAAQGGGISTPGSTSLTHATVVNNVAGNSSTGGVDVNGGSISLAYSVIANNVRANSNEASDCSGTPSFTGVNLVTVISGCNPEGEVIPADALTGPLQPSGQVIEGDAMLAGLSDNGGPTKTTAPLAGSPVVDAVVQPCASGFDQRGVERPDGDTAGSGACDLGAYEQAPLDAAFSLAVDTSEYVDLPFDLPPGTVEVGAASVPVDDILAEIINQDEDAVTGPSDTALRSIALRSIALRSIELQDVALRSIPVDSALRSIVVEATALRSIALRSIALRSIALRSIALSDIPLLDTGGWDALLAGTEFEGLPLQSVTLEDIESAGVSLDGLSLADVSLESTALRSIALRSIVLAGAALRSIDIEVPDESGNTLTGEAAWCYLFDEICGDEGELTAAQLGGLDLLDAQLAGANVDDVPILDISLSGLSSMESTALRSIALRSIALRSIDIQSTALRSIALRSIALRSIDGTDEDWIDLLVDCSVAGVDCSTDPSNESTLGDVPVDALRGDVGVLLDSLASIALACTDSPPPADSPEAESCAFVEGLTYGDLLLAFVSPDDPAWEALDLNEALLQNIADPLQPTFDYVATVTITDGPADVDVNLTLPKGFAAARATGETATFDGDPIEPVTGDLDNLQFVIPNVNSGTYELVVPARAGLVTGTGFLAVGTLDATRGDQGPGTLEDTATVDVVEAARNEPQSTSAATAPTLQLDGGLELAHISSADDVDVFKFSVPADEAGSQARILLSNIPTGVDYDLAVYAQREPSLRNQPEQSLGSVGDIGYDLSPAGDVYSTDTVEDIQLDVPQDLLGLDTYSVRDTSTRRSNEDEEVGTGALREGDYYVAVTSFNGALSDEPYGLRLRLDSAQPPPLCAAARFPSAPSGDPLLTESLPDGVNTVYVTNSRWLAESDGIDMGALSDAIDATDGVKPDGVNGVVAGILPVDGYSDVATAYGAWNDDRCNPDARNAVVREIGVVLDNLPDTVQNLVIIGGDGVVPMAAVPDLTEFSNESTFAPDVAFGAASNEISGALANGYLLSDDPYATDAGISIQNGDHVLYLPTRNIGRLVETGPEIVGQLDRFVEFGGKLDPAATPGGTPGPLSSGVTGYDFLEDGAQAVADELDDVSGVSQLSGGWDDQQFLDLLTQQPDGFDILSPNAHYDYESLLPGAFDGTQFSNGNLVTSTEVADAQLPLGALIFTMGCHAGLPVDDVQIGYSGLTVPDWAQTYAGGGNSYAAHTTYGYGDTEIVAYSERLTQLFAANVAALVNDEPGAAASVGEALRDAKQEYLQTTLVLSPYDEKILQSMTHYGLPMYDIDAGSQAPVAARGQLAAAFESEVPAPSPVTFGPLDGENVRAVDIDLDFPAAESGPTALHLVETEDGDYYEVAGNVVGVPLRPVQPLVRAEVPGSESDPAGGFLITSLTSTEIDVTDTSEFQPYYLQTLIDSSSIEGRVEVGDGSFPASLQRIAPGVGSGPDQLLVAAGQFQDRVEGEAVQRLFTHVGGDLYPLDTSAEQADAPQFYTVDGRIDDQEPVVRFEVTTDSSAERVFVLYRQIEGNNPGDLPVWRGLDLFRAADGERDTWLGAAPVTGTGETAIVEFFGQAVGASGRVGISDNKVYNYLTTLPDESDDFDIDLTCEECEPQNGYFPGTVIATATPTLEGGYMYSVDAGAFTEGQDSVSVSGDGGHVVLAVDPATGGRAYVFFVIDATAPTLTADVRNLVEEGGSRIIGQSVALTADDVGPSGVDSIRYVVEPAGNAPATPQEGCEATENAGEFLCAGSSVGVDITAPGETTILGWARDRAGNETGSPTQPAVTEIVTVDATPPVVTATTAPAVPSSEWFDKDTAVVKVTLAATDESSVEALTYSATGAQPITETEVLADTTDVDITAEGITTITAQAADRFGNVGSLSPPQVVKIDRTLPEATAEVDTSQVELGQTVDLTFSCADQAALSGLATCVVAVNGTTVPTTGNSGTLTIPAASDVGDQTVTVTATDRAGNEFTAETTYGVGYRVCLDYDPTQPKNIGSNYTIKLRLCDAAGQNLSDRRVVLTATSVDGKFDPGPNDSGNANTSFEFRYRSSGYIYNLDTTGFAAAGIGSGLHYLEFDVVDADGFTSTGRAPFTLG